MHACVPACVCVCESVKGQMVTMEGETQYLTKETALILLLFSYLFALPEKLYYPSST